VLAVLSAALVFLPLTAETALLHWNIIGAEHVFVAQLRGLGFWSCLACMAASWFLEKEKEEGGHQAIIFGLLAGLLLAAAWAIETLVPRIIDPQNVVTPHPSPLPQGEREHARACNNVPSPLAGEGQDEGECRVAHESCFSDSGYQCPSRAGGKPCGSPPAVVYGGLAYASLAKGSGSDRSARPDDEVA